MRSILRWIWQHGVISTFLAGFFVILPLAITFWIMSWVAGLLREIIGPGSYVGESLRTLGLRFVANETAATILGWIVVLLLIWLIGFFVKSTARFKVAETFNHAVNHVPVIRTIYGPVSQVVGMLHQQDRKELQAMSVVYCSFGANEGGGFLALLASENRFRFAEQDCLLVYIPTSPIPMTGGLIFVPANAVRKVDMKVEEIMQIYFSMGVLAPGVVPSQYRPNSTPGQT